MKTLSSFNFKDKRVILRSDLNSDVKNGKVILGERIKEAAVTIKELKRKKAKVVVIAHQGQKGKDNYVSLKQHAKLLNKYVKVNFIDNITGKKAIQAIESLKSGEVILLENIRFEKDELNPEKRIKNRLYGLARSFDIYVNDSFSVSHRRHFSIVGFPKYIKKKCAGRLLEKEVKALKKVNLKGCLYVLGGAKPKDYLGLMKGKKILACGLFGQSCLASKGQRFGYQDKYLKKEADLDEKLIKELKKRMKNVITPVDFAVEVKGRRKEISLDMFPNKFEIFDIGQETIDRYVKEIKKAKAIYMKGPAGYSSDKRFSKGTNSLLKAVADNKGFSLIGGGHISDAIERSGINKKKFGHISLSGGALLRYISGEKLPGIEALR